MRLLLAIAIAAFPLVTFGQIPFSLQDRAFITSTSPLRNGLVGYWALEEATGTRYDRSKNGNNLTTAGQGIGVIGNCATMNGVNQAPVTTNLAGFTGSDFTVSLWANFTATNLTQVIAYSSVGSNQWYISLQSGRLAFRIFTNGVAAVITSRYIAPGTWNHIVGQYSYASSELSLVINNSASTAITAAGATNNNTTFRIGAFGQPGSANLFFAGSIDEVGLWNRVLTSDERAILFSSFSGAGFPRYQPTLLSGKLTRLSPIPAKKAQHGFEELNGLLYAVAGLDTPGSDETNSVYAYNPATDSWAQKADYPLKVQSINLRAVNGKLYGIGGYVHGDAAPTNSVYEYDPGADTWTAKSSIPLRVEDAASCVISNKIYVVGGLYANNPSLLISPLMQVYDVAGDSWSTNFAVMPSPRCLGDFGATDGTNMFVVSGTADMTLYGTGALNDSLTVQRYNTELDTWTELKRCLIPVCYKEIEYLNGVIYSFAGAARSTVNYTTEIQAYNVATDTWTYSAALPFAVAYAATAKLGNSIYISGGFPDPYRTELYRFDP